MSFALPGPVPHDVRWFLATTSSGVIVWDASGAIVAANAEALRLIGRPDGLPAAGRVDVRDVFGLGPTSDVRELATALGGARATERVVSRADGGSRRALVLTWALSPSSWATVLVEAGTLAAPAQVLEAGLLQAQKQEALGRLAGGVAHDFGNLLTSVLGHCDAAQRLVSRDSAAWAEIDAIRQTAQQATSLSRQLLAFSRRQVLRPQPLILDDVVARMTPLFRRMLGPRIALEVVWVPGLPRVLADATQIEQVLTNLVVNARDAMPEGGSVRITPSLVSASAFAADTGGDVVPGRTYLCISVRDSGPGMSEEVQRRAFEPFFTTKSRDGGTGLGLPTVQAIVQQAGGGVALHSSPGDGCDVRVYLPALPAVREPGPPARDERPLPGGHETILLVEDREAVRRVAQRFLARRGYRVIEASSAEQARALAESHAAEIDLLLTDVGLGPADGYDLAVELAARRPALKVILMSGYPSELLAMADGVGPHFPFIHKPIDFPTLARLLRDLLDGR